MINFHYGIYRSTDLETIREFTRIYPLAMIITHHNQEWACSMIPLSYDETNDVYVGHCDVNNPQFKKSKRFDCYVVFTGGNCYIPPEAYVTNQLPTWNYTSVNGEGVIEVIDDYSEKYSALKLLVQEMRGHYNGFNLDDNKKRVESLIDGIIALKVKLKAIEGRYKLSQDKSKDDVNSALKYFASSVATSFDTELAKVLIASTRRMDDHR